MEKDIKQHSITYNKGITNQPSYILTDDGELSDCVGLTFENGELKPIQNAGSVTGAPLVKILAVHKGRYLFLDSATNNVYYNQIDPSHFVMSLGGILTDITTIGNTVIASTTTNTYYSLWSGDSSTGSYSYLGNKIPEPEVELRLEYIDRNVEELNYDGMVADWGVPSNLQETFNDAVWGSVRKMERHAHEEGLFVFPFIARVAVELYDGSYMLHSSPQIMLPWYGGDYYLFSNDDMTSSGYIYLPKSALFYKIGSNVDYSKWKDIVKNITIFVSRGHSVFHEDTTFELIMSEGQYVVQDDVFCGYFIDINESSGQKSVVKSFGDGQEYFYYNIWQKLSQWDEVRRILLKYNDNSIIGELKEESSFFKLCDIGLENTGGSFRTTQGRFGSSVLPNLEAQQQLPNDDYHTHDSYLNGNLFSYNGRLHMTGAKRLLFGGLKSFFEWDTNSSHTYSIYVTIKTNDGNKVVGVQTGSTNEAIGRFYFFYPDNRAIQAEIYVDGYYWKTLTLTEHTGINGAYWLAASLPYSSNGYAPEPSASGTSVTPTIKNVESMDNTLMVSEADNPILFLPKGHVAVGNGDIVGIAAVTMALNEYQHGHTPLVAFCTDGIYSLSITSDGYYDSVQAVSREVCISEKTITQVDIGIYFVSKKGLMYMDTSGVKCVSQQMKGTSFEDYIDDCLMAYDYRDSLLHIYRSSRPETYHYVYNMKTGTFTTQSGNDIDNVVNNYPDTLIQDVGTSVKSLLNKPDEKDDLATNYSATLTTRPMKFGNILTLKSIRQLRHLYAMNPNATVSLTIKASNDGVNWATLTSLRGKPWKLYRFEITMTNLKATDRYAGTVVWTQERRTEKLR